MTMLGYSKISKDKTWYNPHPLAGRIFYLLNVTDVHGEGPEQKYIGYDDIFQMRAEFDVINMAMPAKFHAVPGKPDTYLLQNMRNFIENEPLWISFSYDCTWMYADYKNKNKAMHIKFEKVENNSAGTYKGT